MVYLQYVEAASEIWGISPSLAIGIVIVVGIWSLIWKGFALWKSARRMEKIWFVVLLIVNTVGILEILYIFIFSELSRKNKKFGR